MAVGGEAGDGKLSGSDVKKGNMSHNNSNRRSEINDPSTVASRII